MKKRLLFALAAVAAYAFYRHRSRPIVGTPAHGALNERGIDVSSMLAALGVSENISRNDARVVAYLAARGVDVGTLP